MIEHSPIMKLIPSISIHIKSINDKTSYFINQKVKKFLLQILAKVVLLCTSTIPIKRLKELILMFKIMILKASGVK